MFDGNFAKRELKEQIIADLEEFISNPPKTSYGQNEMFREIWNERPHFSELSNSPLLYHGHFQWHWQFLHVLPKGSYGKMKLFKGNILLGTPDEHNKQERFDVFRERKEILTQIYHEVFYGKSF